MKYMFLTQVKPKHMLGCTTQTESLKMRPIEKKTKVPPRNTTDRVKYTTSR